MVRCGDATYSGAAWDTMRKAQLNVGTACMNPNGLVVRLIIIRDGAVATHHSTTVVDVVHKHIGSLRRRAELRCGMGKSPCRRTHSLEAPLIALPSSAAS